MSKPHQPDANVTAHRVVSESTRAQDELPADLEAAWQAWASHLQEVDARTFTLLKAAFEAGWDAGRQSRE